MHILKDFISIEDLIKRWSCEKELIESFTYKSLVGPTLTPWYATEIRTRPDGGKSAIVKKANYLSGCIFDMADVLVVESNHPELVQVETVTNDTEGNMVDGKFVFTEHQLIAKKDLYERWVGAIDEEIAKHFNEGELRVYEHYKGPINGIIWCKPGGIYYQDRHDYSNPGAYDYNDDSCDYFLVEDVVHRETEHPEYIGNVTPESLGLTQANSQEDIECAPLHPGLETISANQAIKLLEITPIDMVDILNGVNIYDGYNNIVDTRRLVTTDEGHFRAHTYSEPYFTEEMLKNVKIYQLNFDQYRNEWGIQPSSKTEKADTSDLESQLAEAQKQLEELEGVRRWNKQFLTEREELRKSLKEKDARIEELETQPPAATEPTTTVNAAKWGNSVAAAFGVWAGILAGDKADWKEDEFRAALAERCSDYHTEVHATAWRLLPDAFKHGRGRPKKNPNKSQQADNS